MSVTLILERKYYSLNIAIVMNTFYIFIFQANIIYFTFPIENLREYEIFSLKPHDYLTEIFSIFSLIYKIKY